MRKRHATNVLATSVLVLLLAGCKGSARAPLPEALLPPSTNMAVLLDPQGLDEHPALAARLGWSDLRAAVEELGFSAQASTRIAMATVNRFEVGAGELVLLATTQAVPSTLTTPQGLAPPFTFSGLDFHEAARSGMYWTRGESWIAICDITACELAAPVLAGDEPSLIEAPPEELLKPLLPSFSRPVPATMVWIPTGEARGRMEAGRFWSTQLLNVFKASITARVLDAVGGFHGLTLEIRGGDGRLETLTQVAMDGTDSADLVAGSLNLLFDAAAGMEAFSQSLGGASGQRPPRPELSVTSRENVLILQLKEVSE